MTEWAQAMKEADQAMADFPGWWVRTVRRREGAGIEALRDGLGLCSATGSAAEVRAVLHATAKCQSASL